jgi:DNA-binding CsgD family transcriptional regulator
MTHFPHRAERGNPRRVDRSFRADPRLPALAFASAFPGVVMVPFATPEECIGARGFIPSTSTNIRLATAAIRLVRQGGSFAPFDLMTTDKRGRKASEDAAESKRLTPRESEVLSRLQRGQPNKIIAYELTLTESTVKVHIRNIMRKMGATNRTEAVYKSQQF